MISCTQQFTFTSLSGEVKMTEDFYLYQCYYDFLQVTFTGLSGLVTMTADGNRKGAIVYVVIINPEPPVYGTPTIQVSSNLCDQHLLYTAYRFTLLPCLFHLVFVPCFGPGIRNFKKRQETCLHKINFI